MHVSQSANRICFRTRTLRAQGPCFHARTNVDLDTHGNSLGIEEDCFK